MWTKHISTIRPEWAAVLSRALRRDTGMVAPTPAPHPAGAAGCEPGRGWARASGLQWRGGLSTENI